MITWTERVKHTYLSFPLPRFREGEDRISNGVLSWGAESKGPDEAKTHRVSVPGSRPAYFLPCLRAARAEGARVPGRLACSLGLGSAASPERRWGRSGSFF